MWRQGLCRAGLGAPSAAQSPPGAQPQAAEPRSHPDLRLRAHQPVSLWPDQSVQGSSLLSLVAGSDVRELVVWGRGLVFVQVWGGGLTVIRRQCSLPGTLVKAVGLHQVSAGEGAGVGGHPPQQAQAQHCFCTYSWFSFSILKTVIPENSIPPVFSCFLWILCLLISY